MTVNISGWNFFLSDSISLNIYQNYPNAGMSMSLLNEYIFFQAEDEVGLDLEVVEEVKKDSLTTKFRLLTTFFIDFNYRWF